MTVRAVMYAALFTAGLEAIAIYATQEKAVPASLPVATQPTAVPQNAPNRVSGAAAAMASATEKPNKTRPQYEPRQLTESWPRRPRFRLSRRPSMNDTLPQLGGYELSSTGHY